MHLRVVAVALATVLVTTTSAQAEWESWNWLELRLPVSRQSRVVPRSIRLLTDVRFGERYPGLGLMFFRGGPLWDLHRHLFVAVHGTAIAVQSEPDVFSQEYRLELEPTLRGRWGPIDVFDRNRLEYRWLEPGNRWRYRNLLRVNYWPQGTRVIPFVWNEVLIDLSGQGFNQNRATAGLSFLITPETRFELAYMLRSRAVPDGWAHDNVVVAYLFFAPDSGWIFD